MTKIHAPLGSRAARSSPDLRRRESAALTRLETWFAEHPTTWVGVSGGKDSTVLLHLAHRVNPDVTAVFFDSGMEFPQTITYLDRLTTHLGVAYDRIPADPTALDVMVASGNWDRLADPARARLPDNALSTAVLDNPMHVAQSRYGRHSTYGLRADESPGRRVLLAKTRGVVTRTRNKAVDHTWLAPLWQWTTPDIFAYLGAHQVPVNPLYAQMDRLGVPRQDQRVSLMVSGSSMNRGRWAITRALAPDAARRIEAELPMLRDLR